jgi:hypothetical protein
VTELERTLSRLGAELDWPPTPDLAATVRARVSTTAPEPGGPAAAPGRRPRLVPPVGLRRSLAIALVALLLLAGGAFAALPGVRDAVLEAFGLQGATVERRATLPTPPPARPLDLGTRTTLAAAQRGLGFEPLVPGDLGPPDGVYVRRGVPGAELSLAYGSRPGLPRAGSTRLGLLVTEFRGDLAPEYLGKVVGLTATVERLRIDGWRAIWIEGAPHFFLYRDPDGDVVESQVRLAQNVLLLERGRLLVRLEGAFDRDRAIALARSLR